MTQSRAAFPVLWRAGTNSIDCKIWNVEVILFSLCATGEKPKGLGPDSVLSSLGGEESYTRQTLQ